MGSLGFPRGTATILRLLPSLDTPVPPSSSQAAPEVLILLSGIQSGVQLLGLIRGGTRGQGIPICSLVIEIHHSGLPNRRLNGDLLNFLYKFTVLTFEKLET
jgi:hypothetical protein